MKAALALALALTGCAAPTKQAISLPNATRLATYSPGIRTGNLLFLSGTLGTLPGTRTLPDGITNQTRQALENIRALLAAAGLAPKDLVKCTVFMTDMADYDAVNAVYAEFMKDTDPPARSAVAVAGLPLGALVEIECIAAVR